MTVPKHQLSKSTFMYGYQCSKRLWLHKYQPALKDEEDAAQTAIFQSGTNIGVLAHQLFPYGVDCSPETPFQYQQAVEKTANCIQKGVNLIYEAAFQFDGLLAAIDILVKQNGKWYAFEVKGTNSVKPAHLLDAAFQYHVITQSGLPLEDFSILHLNREYIRKGPLDIAQLFTASSVLEQIAVQQPTIISTARQLKAVLQQKQPPEIAMGSHCTKPYACNFMGYCSIGREEEWIEPEAKQINQEAIQSFLKPLKYPLQFLDFETWMTAIPEQDGHWPYRKIPFQFSLHIQPNKKSELQHHYYLATDRHTPHLEFAEQLLAALPQKGSILVYNLSFENSILNELKNEFVQLAPAIESIQKRLVDLMPVFRYHYRLPAMQYSYSIKAVLPAVVPGFGYDELSIGNGGDASQQFYELSECNEEAEKQSIREALLAYCEMDTLAMVQLLQKLRAV